MSCTWRAPSRQRRKFVQDKERQELRRQLVPGKDAQEQRPRFVPDKERQEQRGRFKPCKDAQEQRYRFVPDKGAQELRRRFVPPRETDQGTGAGAVTLFPSGGLVFSGTGRDERNQLKKREKWDLAVLLILYVLWGAQLEKGWS